MRTIRLKLDSKHPQLAGVGIDANTSQNPTTWRANATTFEVGCFQDGAPRDLTGYTNIQLVIRPDQVTGTNLAYKTAATPDSATIIAGAWTAGTAEHVSLAFTDAEMNLDLAGAAEKRYWLCVSALDPSGNETTLGTSWFTLSEDNNATADPPPENPGAGITQEAADARYALYVLTVADSAAKLALTGVADNQQVRITGEGDRIERYLGDGQGFRTAVSFPVAISYGVGAGTLAAGAVFVRDASGVWRSEGSPFISHDGTKYVMDGDAGDDDYESEAIAATESPADVVTWTRVADAGKGNPATLPACEKRPEATPENWEPLGTRLTGNVDIAVGGMFPVDESHLGKNLRVYDSGAEIKLEHLDASGEIIIDSFVVGAQIVFLGGVNVLDADNGYAAVTSGTLLPAMGSLRAVFTWDGGATWVIHRNDGYSRRDQAETITAQKTYTADIRISHDPDNDDAVLPRRMADDRYHQTMIAMRTGNLDRSETTTLADDTQLTLPVEANTRYLAEVFIQPYGIGGTSQGINVGISAPSGYDMEMRFFASNDGSFAAGLCGRRFSDWGGNPRSIPSVSSSGECSVEIKGMIETSGTAGNVTVQWAQATSNTNATRVAEGSYIRLTKIN